MGRLTSKVVLVIGGGADGPAAPGETLPIGNGRAIAMQCAREGASVMVADLSLDSAEATAEAIRAEGGAATAIACDVTQSAQSLAAVEATVAEFGALHGLVNNAAMTDMTDVLATDELQFQRILALNVHGYFLSMKHAIPHLVRAGGGAIVNVSSLAARRTGPGSGVAYDTSKAALTGLTQNTAVAVAASNVRVNNLLPGIINSTILRRMTSNHPGLDFEARIPMRRMGSPWEVGKVAAFLLSDDASYVTGVDLLVDGAAALLL